MFFSVLSTRPYLTRIENKTIIDRMAEAVVDDAVLGDASTSACLLIDRKFYAKPNDVAGVKDRSITTGLMFRKRSISISKGIVNITHSTDPNFNSRLPPPIILSDPHGKITATPKGLEEKFSSFDRRILFSITEREILNLMGIVAIPFVLTSSATDLIHNYVFSGSPNDNVTISIQMNLAIETSGVDSLRGNIKIINEQGEISGT